MFSLDANFPEFPEWAQLITAKALIISYVEYMIMACGMPRDLYCKQSPCARKQSGHTRLDSFCVYILQRILSSQTLLYVVTMHEHKTIMKVLVEDLSDQLMKCYKGQLYINIQNKQTSVIAIVSIMKSFNACMM